MKAYTEKLTLSPQNVARVLRESIELAENCALIASFHQAPNGTGDIAVRSIQESLKDTRKLVDILELYIRLQ